MKLYTFWRSIATLRVRIAMNIKGVSPEVEYVDLIKGEQRNKEYEKVNPQKLLPALILDDGGPPLFQSMAIMEWLEETQPQPPLLPRDPRGRARVRGLCQIAISDAHPMSVPRVRNYLLQVLKLEQAQMLAYVRHWQTEALRAYETHLTEGSETGKFCHGDTVTLADICLVGQAVGSSFFDVDVKGFPTVQRIFDECMKIDAFKRAHPLNQPGAPAELPKH
jgi:maleylacetoacetate isomerase